MSDTVQWTINMRPKTLKDFIGMESEKKLIYKYAQTDTWPTAMLFQGHFGGGKTTLAKIVAKMMSCTNPDEEGNPCCECPACKAIDDETFNRETMQIDGGQASKDDVIDKVMSFVSTPAWKDRAKVVIIEEFQELSKKAVNSLLKIIESPRKGIHYIFTSMDESRPADAITSRCVTFKFPYPTMTDIYNFLEESFKRAAEHDARAKNAKDTKNASVAEDEIERRGFDKTSSELKAKEYNGKGKTVAAGEIAEQYAKMPDEFRKAWLEMIAENSQGSFRLALQYLQRAVYTKAYSVEMLENICGLKPTGKYYDLIPDLLNGSTNDEIFKTIFDSSDYNGTFKLIMKILSDAESYRVFGKVPGNSAFFERQAKAICSHKNYNVFREEILAIDEASRGYLSKARYILGFCRIIERCKKPSLSNSDVSSTAPRRRMISE